MSHSISHSCLTPHTPRLTLVLIYKEWDMNPNPSHIPWLTSHPMRSETPHVSLLVWYVNLWCVRSDTCGVRHEKLDMGCEEWEMRSDAWGEECDMGRGMRSETWGVSGCFTLHISPHVSLLMWSVTWGVMWGVRHGVRSETSCDMWEVRHGVMWEERHGEWGVRHEERRSETWGVRSDTWGKEEWDMVWYVKFFRTCFCWSGVWSLMLWLLLLYL